MRGFIPVSIIVQLKKSSLVQEEIFSELALLNLEMDERKEK
jgi:hypothetical protein